MPRIADVVGGVLLAAALVAPASAADKVDPLARARALYNQQKYQEAVAAAEQARLVSPRVDAADLIEARAYLERYRASATSDDLTNARDRLRRLDPDHLGAHERIEYIVGLGETLYFDESYGAAADVFDSVLARPDLGPEARDRVIDWWATAVDQDARPRPDLERQPMYQKIRDRMQRELNQQPSSASAPYWLAAAARAQGDLQAAWDAALAGWVRASLSAGHGEALRADLDQLVLKAIVPERAKSLAQSPDQIRNDWERFKERWKK
jgi:hypothetical protein